MRIAMKGAFLFALALVAAFVFMPNVSAFAAASSNSDDTEALRNGPGTDSGVVIKNGQPANLDAAAETDAGRLYVGYFKTNGTKTNASARGTQDTKYVSDTVLGVPTAQMVIISVKDGDSTIRQMRCGGFPGWDPNYFNTVGTRTGPETYPRYLPDQAGDTNPTYDSVPWMLIELEDTGVATLHIINTSNYACTMLMTIHMPDTDFRVNRTANSGYKEKDSDAIRRFVTSMSGDTTSAVSAGEITAASHVPLNCTVPQVGNAQGNRLAEDAETWVYLRVAAASQATARDSLWITVVLFPDSGPVYQFNGKFGYARIFHDTGYIGDNDTEYGKGGSEDSVSVFTLVATAIVRVIKKDTVFAPPSYVLAAGETDIYKSARSNDTVPGARILYDILYDNDGNRRADSLTIIDYLDPNVDLLVDSYFNGEDTYYANGIGVDTRMGHARWKLADLVGGKPEDTYAIVAFSPRSDSGTFTRQLSPFNGFGTLNDSIVDTVAAIRITWPASALDRTALQRDQVDDGTYAGSSALDPLFTHDTTFVTLLGSSDSGDCGRIRFAVVIR